MEKYLRLGEIPKDEKSVNFLKISLKEVENFTDTLEIAGYDEAIRLIPECALEDGVSVFAIGEDQKPVLDNMSLLKSFCERLGGGVSYVGKPIKAEPFYIVHGKRIGTGNAGEPLLKEIKVLEKLEDVDIARIRNMVIDILKENFEFYEKTEETENIGENNIYCFYLDGVTPEWTFAGYTFRSPKKGFVEKTE